MTVTSFLPQLTGNELVAPYVEGLSEAEQSLVTGLASKLNVLANLGLVRQAYYDGTQPLANLGVSVPQQMQSIRTVVDWPRISVDPLVQGCIVDGFRMPGSPDIDDDLTDIWQANDLDAEAPLAFLDSLVQGRGYMIVGSPDSPDDAPIITVESPLNLAMNWDPRIRRGTAAFQSYEDEGIYRAVLYQPNYDIFMSKESTGQGWQVDKRDVHNMGELSVVRLPNRQRSADREGMSEITPAIMNTTDSACRSLLGMEIAREFYSIPHRYILGAQESDFQNPDGTPKTALDLSMSKFLALERDEEGNTPSVGQFTAFDPSVFTKIIDEHAQLMASYTQFPPSYFGQTTTANPSSADAIRTALEGRDKRREQCQGQFSDPLERVMRLAWRFAHGGAPVPQEMRRMETVWVDASTQTPAATAESSFKLVQAGILPAQSDVVLEENGFTAVQRQRIKLDRAQDAGESILAELATSLAAKEARADVTVATDITGKPAISAAPAAPAPVVPKPGPPSGAK